MDRIAQIAFKNRTGWVIYAPHYFVNGSKEVEMPAVNCPIVDTRRANQKGVDQISAKYITFQGVNHVGKLISELLSIGCFLVIPVTIHKFSIALPAAM